MFDDMQGRLQRLIDLREGISREIANYPSRVGENTRRREDRLGQLEAEYADVQRQILDLDSQIRIGRNGQIAVR